MPTVGQGRRPTRLRPCLYSDAAIHFYVAAALLAYIIAGGAIFSALERDAARGRSTTAAAALEADLIEWEGSEMAKIITKEEFLAIVQKYSDRYMHAIKESIDPADPRAPPKDVWALPSAAVFAATIVTTIGYGHISPQTPAGMLAFAPYAVFGIALMGVWLTLMGRDLGRVIRWFEQMLRRQGMGRIVAGWIAAGTFVVLTLGTFIYGTALILQVTEEWSFAEASYACWVTATTVGFGDYVPDADTIPEWLGATLWVLFALSCTAGVIDYSARSAVVLWTEFKDFALDAADFVDTYDDEVLGFDVGDALSDFGVYIGLLTREPGPNARGHAQAPEGPPTPSGEDNGYTDGDDAGAMQAEARETPSPRSPLARDVRKRLARRTGDEDGEMREPLLDEKDV